MEAPQISGKKLASCRSFARATECSTGCCRSCRRRGWATSASTAIRRTLVPVEYYFKVPDDIADRLSIVVDPMLATGHSAAAALTGSRRRRGDDQVVCLLAAPEGIKVLQAAHPDVPIFTAAVDDHLNDHGYIIPGLGDAGDRMFGTK
jgi:uracil phosphoribosyltransferase